MKKPQVLKLDQGNPAFLSKIFQDLLGCIEPIVDFSYPSPEGDPDLLEQLYKIFPQFKYIVVTNGGTGALCATLEYFSKMNKSLYTSTPYWSRTPTIAQRSSLIMDQSASSIHLVTSPNNPDGSLYKGVEEHIDIHDACYYNPFYPVYGECSLLKSKCSIFSSSKMLGTAGFRIGWIGTNDLDIYEHVVDYVDFTSVGVSVLSQKEVAGILRHIRSGKYNKGFELAKKVLEHNHILLEHKLGTHLDQLNNSGLFGWFKVKDFEKFDDALFDAHVSLMPGRAFGMEEDGWYRVNLGAVQDTVDTALERLAGLLSK